MEDIFSEEQGIYDTAVLHIKETENDTHIVKSKFEGLTKEYGRLLKQLRRTIKLSDRVADNLNTSIYDLRDKIHIDALTGIYNRRFMEDNLDRIIKSIARTGGCLSVLMMDVDFFKRYNDTYGHSEGDTCLKTVADAIKESLSRPDDLAIRYGGEEFSVILPETDEPGARFIAGKILTNMREKNVPHEANDAAPCVTISIGVTTGIVSREQSGDDYLKQADKALYMSKESGRNRYTYLGFEEEK